MRTKHSLNPIPKAMREKKRYILFSVASDVSFDEASVVRAINNIILSIFGSFGASKINSKLLEWNRERGIGILKCERSSKNKAIVALQFIREINGAKASINVIAVSGTIKALRDRLHVGSS